MVNPAPIRRSDYRRITGRGVGNDFSCSNLPRHFALDLIVHQSDPKTRKVQIADVCVVAHRTVQLPGTDVKCVRRKMRELVDFDRLGDCPLPQQGNNDALPPHHLHTYRAFRYRHLGYIGHGHGEVPGVNTTHCYRRWSVRLVVFRLYRVAPFPGA